MPNRAALEMAEDQIKAELRDLNDLPRELANTIANIYYKCAVAFVELDEMRQRNGSIPSSMKREIGNKPFQELFRDFTANVANVIEDKSAAMEMVKGLRDIDKSRQPQLYRYSVDFVLDCLKYNIKNPGNKTGIRRMIERKFITPNEIPGLIDLMSFS